MLSFYISSGVLLFLLILIFALYQQRPEEISKKHTVKYVNKKLIIDEFFIVVSFRSGSLNCELFDYLNDNKEREITLRELEVNVFRGRDVNFCKIIDSFGFRGDLRKVLFSVGDKSITYHPSKINSINSIKIN